MDTAHATPALRADARRNRAKVLDAARRAFAEEGDAVSLGEIAKRAGVGAGTVYRHFPNKDELREAVLSQRIERLAKLAADLMGHGDSGAAFDLLCTEVIVSGAANRDLCDSFADDGWPKAFLLASGRRFNTAMESLLAKAQRDGAVRDDLTGDDTRALFTGGVAMQRMSEERDRLCRMARIALDAVLLGPVTKPGDRPDSSHESVNSGDETRRLRCASCGRALRAAPTGRPARYCGAACRQRAHRARSADRARATDRSGPGTAGHRETG